MDPLCHRQAICREFNCAFKLHMNVFILLYFDFLFRCANWLEVIQIPSLFQKSCAHLGRNYRVRSVHVSSGNYTNGNSDSRLLPHASPDQDLSCKYLKVTIAKG